MKFKTVENSYQFRITKTLLNQEIQNRITLYLNIFTCSKHEQQDGCTICGFNQKLSEEQKEKIDTYQCLQKAFDQLNLFDKPIYLNLYTAGSFLNLNEINKDARRFILNKLSKVKELRYLCIESRAEFINDEALEEIKSIIPGCEICVGIGIETMYDSINNKLLNKGSSIKLIEEKIRLLKRYGISIRAYVLLKPPYISEEESINIAVDTINYARELDVEEIHLESCTVQRKTELEQLYINNSYRPPWLWSIIQVINQTDNTLKRKNRLYISPFKYNIKPIAIPTNCPICNKKVSNLIFNKYNLGKINIIDDAIHCECKKEWEEIMKNGLNQSLFNPFRTADTSTNFIAN